MNLKINLQEKAFYFILFFCTSNFFRFVHVLRPEHENYIWRWTKGLLSKILILLSCINLNLLLNFIYFFIGEGFDC